MILWQIYLKKFAGNTIIHRRLQVSLFLFTLLGSAARLSGVFLEAV